MEKSKVIIREVTDSDVPNVVQLVKKVLEEFGLKFGEGSKTDEEVTQLPASYTANRGGFWVACEHDTGKLLGSCGVFPVDDQTFEVRKMYLYPHARGCGIADQLLEKCVLFARQQGAKRMVLDTTDQMERAISFYVKNGFTRDDSQIRGARCSQGYVRNL